MRSNSNLAHRINCRNKYSAFLSSKKCNLTLCRDNRLIHILWLIIPYSHMRHKIKYTVNNIPAILWCNSVSNSHLCNKSRHTKMIKAVGKSCIKHSNRRIYPHKLCIHHLRIWKQLFLRIIINSYLWHLIYKYIA